MCELFAMSSNHPSTVRYSLPDFAKHGARTRSNRSGWGIAYFQDREAFLVKEPEPAADSPWVDFIARQDIESDCVIAHVRLATIGQPALHNTHPFRRSLAGRVHVLAHNGTLKGLHVKNNGEHLTHYPIGDTDSELAFCMLLERMRAVWTKPGDVPPWEERLDVFAGFASELKTYGSCNLLYGDSDVLFVHAHRRIYERKDGSFGEPEPPGLSMRNGKTCAQSTELSCNGLRVGFSCKEAILFASVPLGEGGWEPLDEGTAVAVRGGEELARVAT